MKDHDKNKQWSYLQYWDVNNVYGWAISQKLSIKNFKWVKDISKFDESFIKIIMKKVMKNILLKLMFIILKNYMTFTMIYHFSLKD